MDHIINLAKTPSAIRERAFLSKAITTIVIASILLFFRVGSPIYSQESPGGIEVDLSAWLKADAGTSTTVNETLLDSWEDQSFPANNAVSTNDNRPTYLDGASPLAINFNPTLDFRTPSGRDATETNKDYLDITDIPDTRSTFIVLSKDSPLGNTRHYFYGADGTFNRQSYCGRNGYYAPRNRINGQHRRDGATFDPYRDLWTTPVQMLSAITNTDEIIANIGGNEGTRNTLHRTAWNGRIAEVVIYTSPLGASERLQVESYLALKYGIHLNQDSPQNYLASDGSPVWEALTAGEFMNNIFGIGRDDTSGLLQKQSKSNNGDALLTVGLGGITVSNLTNGNSFGGDYSFMVMAHNNGTASWTSLNTVPGYRILERQWAVQEMGDVGTVELQFEVDKASFDVPNLERGTEYYLVTDPNGDGNFADGTATVLTNTSGDRWNATLDLDNGSIFTLATLGSPGFTIDPVTLTVTEGATHTFTVVLDAPPTSNVTFQITSADTNEATVDLVPLTFTPADWDMPQTVTVFGVDDMMFFDDTTDITVTVDQANSDDSFDTLASQVISVILKDDEVLSFSPGGAAPNLDIWLRADVGTGTRDLGTTVTTWADVSSNGRNLSAEQSPSYRPNGINFNPTVLYEDDDKHRLDNPDLPIQGSTFYAVARSRGAEAELWVSQDGDGLLYVNDEGVPNGVGFYDNTPERPTQNSTLTWEPGEVALFKVSIATGSPVFTTAYLKNGGSEVTIDGLEDDINPGLTTTNYYEVLGNWYTLDYTEPFGDVAEIAVYGTDVQDATDEQRVQSYLALKYGISLDQTMEQHYVAHDGTRIWNATGTGSSGFHHNIFGIGRDTESDLDQRISRSSANDGILTLATTADFTNNNLDGGRISLNDLHFQVLAHNNGVAAWTSTNTLFGYEILERQWEVQETGTVGHVHLQFDVDNDSFNVPDLLSRSEYYLVTDPNADGNYGDGVPIALINTGGSLWTTQMDLVPGTRFTLGTAAPPGINLDPGTLTLGENGGNGAFSIVLEAPPAANVDLEIKSEDTAEATVDVATLRFTETNWDMPQTITVTGVDDTAIPSDTVVIRVSVVDASSSDEYDGLSETVAVALTNDDVLARAPGGVGMDLGFWAKANTGIGTAIEGTTVSIWADQSGFGRDLIGENSPAYMPQGINFNPTVIYENNDRNIFTSAEISVQGSTLYAVGMPVSGSDNEFWSTQANDIALYLTGNEKEIGYYDNDPDPGTQNSVLTWSNGEVALFKVNIGDGNSNFSASYSKNGGTPSIINSLDSTTNGNPNNYLALGNWLTDVYSEPFGQIAETVIYTVDSQDSDAQQRIQSYLALKYGITLDQGTAQNYLNSDGDIVWNASAAGAFNSSIFGIGYDEGSDLDQKQSKSVNPDALLTIGLGLIAGNNADNANTFVSDQSFMFLAHNGGGITAYTTTGAPQGYTLLDRAWGIQETGSVGHVTIRVPDDSSALPVKLPVTPLHKLSLIRSTDTDFSDDVPLAMTLKGTDWELTLDLEDGEYITFATPGIWVEFTDAEASDLEDNGGNLPTLTVSGGETATAMTIEVALSETLGTAVEGEDYTFATPRTVTIPAGDYSTPVQIVIPELSISSDVVSEANETFILRLQNPIGDDFFIGNADGSDGVEDTHVYTITNDDLSVEFESYIYTSTNEAMKVVGSLMVSGAMTTTPRSVDVILSDDSVVGNAEFVGSTAVVIPEDDYSTLMEFAFCIVLTDDFKKEDNQTFTLSLDNFSPGLSEGDANGDGTVLTMAMAIVQNDNCLLNCDLDDDGDCDINCDTDADGHCDLNCDTDMDGGADINIDGDEDGDCDLNCDRDGDGDCDLFCDVDGDKNADLSFDDDGNGVCDRLCDTDSDGECDTFCGTVIGVRVAEAMTPNGDNINDTWQVGGLEAHSNAIVKVYNRYGQEVFSAIGYQGDWNGRYGSNSDQVPAGSYYYVIDLRNGTAPLNGWIFISY